MLPNQPLTYTTASQVLPALKELLERDGNFKVSYTTVWAAISNRVEQLALIEAAGHASRGL